MLKWILPLFVIGLAVPAGVVTAEPEKGTYYRYTTESGSIAFTDELKRVPARYRDGAEAVPAASIFGYKRTTVTKKGANRTVTRRSAPVAEADRARSQAAPGGPQGAPQGGTVSFEVEPGVYLHVPTDELTGDEDEPVRVHRKFYHDEFGMDRTRTQISRGDKLLVDIKEDADPYRKRFPEDVEMPFELPEDEDAD